MRLLSRTWIGRIRRLLFTGKPSKWNALVRDMTAKLG
jgi:hypothetical protein